MKLAGCCIKLSINAAEDVTTAEHEAAGKHAAGMRRKRLLCMQKRNHMLLRQTPRNSITASGAAGNANNSV